MPGNYFYVRPVRCRNRFVLFYSAPFQHRKYRAEHNLRNNEFYCRLPYFQKERLFCPGVCRQRPYSDLVMDFSIRGRYVLYFGGNMFYRLFHKRYVRIYKLVENEKKTARKNINILIERFLSFYDFYDSPYDRNNYGNDTTCQEQLKNGIPPETIGKCAESV